MTKSLWSHLHTGTAYRFLQATRRHQTQGAETYHARPAACARPTWRVRALPTPLPVCISACPRPRSLRVLAFCPLAPESWPAHPPPITRAVGTIVMRVCTIAGPKDCLQAPLNAAVFNHYLTFFSIDVPGSLRSNGSSPLCQGRWPERAGPPAVQRICRHLLQGQRCRRLRRLGARSQPLGLLLQPLVNFTIVLYIIPSSSYCTSA